MNLEVAEATVVASVEQSPAADSQKAWAGLVSSTGHSLCKAGIMAIVGVEGWFPVPLSSPQKELMAPSQEPQRLSGSQNLRTWSSATLDFRNDPSDIWGSPQRMWRRGGGLWAYSLASPSPLGLCALPDGNPRRGGTCGNPYIQPQQSLAGLGQAAVHRRKLPRLLCLPSFPKAQGLVNARPQGLGYFVSLSLFDS